MGLHIHALRHVQWPIIISILACGYLMNVYEGARQIHLGQMRPADAVMVVGETWLSFGIAGVLLRNCLRSWSCCFLQKGSSDFWSSAVLWNQIQVTRVRPSRLARAMVVTMVVLR